MVESPLTLQKIQNEASEAAVRRRAVKVCSFVVSQAIQAGIINILSPMVAFKSFNISCRLWRNEVRLKEDV